MAPLRTVLSLALLGLATSAGQYGSSPPHSSYGAPKPSSSYGVPKPSGSYGVPKLSGSSGGPSGSQGIHAQAGQVHSKYYLSWLHGRQLYTWSEANHECRRQDYNRLVSLTTAEKDKEIADLLLQAPIKVDFYWTSGMKKGRAGKFVWGDGTSVCPRDDKKCFENWSRKGHDGRPQPDNYEGHEYCLTVMNNTLNDGIVWHDIACHKKKHFVCEH